MPIKLEDTLKTPLAHSTELLNPIEILDAMIELRVQMRAIEEQIQALQPAFFTACLALNTDKCPGSCHDLAPSHTRSMGLFCPCLGAGNLVQTPQAAVSTDPRADRGQRDHLGDQVTVDHCLSLWTGNRSLAIAAASDLTADGFASD
jgi:hypothetical protein